MRFEWDLRKSQSNRAKHHVSFELAESIFQDPFSFGVRNRIVDGEERWMTFGSLSSGEILAVVHTTREMNGMRSFELFPHGGQPHMNPNDSNKVTDDHRDELAELAAMSDEDIDLSDIPEMTDEEWQAALKRGVYRPVKQQLTIRLDADIVDWFKRTQPKYQTAMNEVLRKHMIEQSRKTG